MSKTNGLKQITLEKFSGGRNGSQVAFAIPDDQFADILNFRGDSYALKLRPGQNRINTTSLFGTSSIRGLARYYRATGTDKWWITVGGTTAKKVTDSGTIANYGLNLTRGKMAQFGALQGRQYMVNGADNVTRFLGNTATNLQTEVIGAPTGPPRVLSNIVVIDACDATANWVATAGIGSLRGTLSLPTATPWEGAANLMVTGAGVKSGFWGRKLKSLNLNLSQARAISIYFRCNISNQQVSVQIRDSASGWTNRIDAVGGPANQWTRVVFDLSAYPAAYLDGVTDILVGCQKSLAASDTLTLEWDYVLVGDALGGGTQDAWYAYAYYKNSFAKYSTASPRSSLVKLDPDQLSNLVQMRGTAKTIADKLQLYRTQAGLSAIYYFVTAIANPGPTGAKALATVRDTVKDSLLGAKYDRSAASGVQAPPLGASIICQHNQRMIYNDPNSWSKLWHSNLRDAETCPDVEMSVANISTLSDSARETSGFWTKIDPDNGQRVTALLSIGYGVLLACKERSSYVEYGDSMLNVEVQKVSDGAGCPGKYAVALCEGTAFWVDWQNRTAWTWSAAGGLNNVGEPIQDLLKQVTQANAANICCAYHDRRVNVSYLIGTRAEWVEYDFRTGTWYDPNGEIVRSGFTRHRGQNRGLMAVAGGPGDTGQLVYGDVKTGSGAGFIRKVTDSTSSDQLTAITGVWCGKSFNFREPGREHRVRFVDVEALGTSSAARAPRLQFGFFVDKEGSLTGTPNWTAGSTMRSRFWKWRVSVPPGVSGKRLQPWLKVTASLPIEIHNISLWYQQVR